MTKRDQGSAICGQVVAVSSLALSGLIAPTWAGEKDTRVTRTVSRGLDWVATTQ